MAPQAAKSTELVDFFHAAEQLKAATDAAYGETARGAEFSTRRIDVLRHETGGVEQRGLRYLRCKHWRRKADRGGSALAWWMQTLRDALARGRRPSNPDAPRLGSYQERAA